MPWVVFLGFAVPLSWIDFTQHRLPNRYVGGFAVVTTLGLLALGALTQMWSVVGRSLLAGLVLSVCFIGLSLLSPLGIGMGDAKLMLPVGMYLGWFGWNAVWWGVVGSFVLAGVIGLVLVLGAGRTLQSSLPFGPYLLASVPICGVASAWDII